MTRVGNDSTRFLQDPTTLGGLQRKARKIGMRTTTKIGVSNWGKNVVHPTVFHSITSSDQPWSVTCIVSYTIVNDSY